MNGKIKKSTVKAFFAIKSVSKDYFQFSFAILFFICYTLWKEKKRAH